MGNVTKEIAKYIAEKQISTAEIEEKLHISRQKLAADTNDKLTAEEFLTLCAYLKIRPESYYYSLEEISESR